MHLLFLNRCYGPSSGATGRLLAQLCADLAATHTVTVVAEDNGGGSTGAVTLRAVPALRLPKTVKLGRAVRGIGYLVGALARGRGVGADVVIAETDPPLLGLVGARLARRAGAAFFYYCQDLYPDVALAAGQLRPGATARFLARATRNALGSAERILSIGLDMSRRLVACGAPPSRVRFLPNWADTEAVRPLPAAGELRAEWGISQSFVVMYSGNLGLCQDLERIVEAAGRWRTEEAIRLVLVGDGVLRERLARRAAALGLAGRIMFRPPQPEERLAKTLAAADLHLVPLAPGVGGMLVPSKLYGVMAAARAYVAAVDAGSDVAEVTLKHECGVWIPPGDVEALAGAVRWASSRASARELAVMGRRGRRAVEQHFGRRQAVERFRRVLREVAG